MGNLLQKRQPHPDPGNEKWDDVPVGTCKYCQRRQRSPARGGLWVGGYPNWVCDACRRARGVRSYPVACEYCAFDGVTWYQGHTYDCQRCRHLGLRPSKNGGAMYGSR